MTSLSSSTKRNHSEMSSSEEEPSRTLVFLTVSFYLVAALVMVFVNKWVLNSVSVPIFLLWCQLAIAVILLKVSNSLGLIKLPKNVFKNVFNTSSQFKLLRSVLPLVLINALGLIFNTYCLKYVDASFYQVARGLILPFTILASYIFLGIKSSLKINISSLVVCMGFMIGVSSERFSVSYLGVILGVFSSITTSMHSIIVKQTLEKIPSTIALTYYSNALSALIVFPLILISGELPTIVTLLTSGYDQFKTFLFGTLVTGLFGFLICIAGFLSIKVTSPVTHMISSAVRGVIQTGLGALLFGDQITTGRISGIAIILLGSLYYTWVKDQEMLEKKAQNSKNVPMKKMNMEESESLIIQVDKDVDEDEHDGGDIGLDISSPNSKPSLQSDHRNAQHVDDDDDDDDDESDEDLKELKKAEKALGI